jgi:hypothetical protein
MVSVNQTQVAPISIFQHAETFISCIDYLHTAPPERIVPAGVPLMVLSAFAAELYLKCLVCRKNGKAPRGHYLHDLYSQLDATDKSALDAHWSLFNRDRNEFNKSIEVQENRAVPRALKDAIVEGNKAFEQLRYIYEGPPPFRFLLGDLPLALRRTIIDSEPTWAPQDRNFVGRSSSPLDLPSHLLVGTITYWIRELEKNWPGQESIRNMSPVGKDQIHIDSYVTKNGQISFTISGPLGRTFTFRVLVPAVNYNNLFVCFSWTTQSISLILNDKQVATIDVSKW